MLPSMAGPAPLSVAIITLDEERNLDRCLRSVAWAEERVVVDCGSRDATLQIATRHGCKVVERPWPGYAEQKNFAVDQTRHEWVLSLDADEWLTPLGVAEIRQVLRAPRADVFAFPRHSAFCGRFIRHAWTPDWQLRLFRKGRARFAGGRVHESLRPAAGARVQRLRQPLQHLPYRSVAEYAERIQRYTDLAARSIEEEPGRPGRTRLWLSPPAAFFKHYVLKQGFRDGVRGLIVSAGAAWYVLLKYAKVWEAAHDADAEPVDAAPPAAESDEHVKRANAQS